MIHRMSYVKDDRLATIRKVTVGVEETVVLAAMVVVVLEMGMGMETQVLVLVGREVLVVVVVVEEAEEEEVATTVTRTTAEAIKPKALPTILQANSRTRPPKQQK
jgi:Tfp pilus assembly protein PilZ